MSISRRSVCALLAILAACSNADDPIKPNFIGTTGTVIDALHSCALLAVPANSPSSTNGFFGSGSIVTRNRVLTAAHVVQNAAFVNAFFYIDTVTNPDNKRKVRSIWIQQMFGYDATTRVNDVAIVLFAHNIFPAANVIAISVLSEPRASDPLQLAGFGFTSAYTDTPSQVPIMAKHVLATTCGRSTSRTHFCASAVAPGMVCPGDNGSGLYSGTRKAARLIGVLSLLETSCRMSVTSVFTKLGDANVRMFLLSQDIVAQEDEEPYAENELPEDAVGEPEHSEPEHHSEPTPEPETEPDKESEPEQGQEPDLAPEIQPEAETETGKPPEKEEPNIENELPEEAVDEPEQSEQEQEAEPEIEPEKDLEPEQEPKQESEPEMQSEPETESEEQSVENELPEDALEHAEPDQEAEPEPQQPEEDALPETQPTPDDPQGFLDGIRDTLQNIRDQINNILNWGRSDAQTETIQQSIEIIPAQ